MRFLTFDISSKTGWVLGAPPARPTYGLWRLKRPQDDVEVACEEAARKLRDICFLEDSRPDKIVYEAPIPPYTPGREGDTERERKIVRSVESIVLPQQVIGAIRGLAACYGIDCHAVHAATIRKHFLGRANLGSREATKRAVVERCRLLRYVDPGFSEENICDSLAVYDYAVAKWGRTAPAQLFLHGERARP